MVKLQKFGITREACLWVWWLTPRILALGRLRLKKLMSQLARAKRNTLPQKQKTNKQT